MPEAAAVERAKSRLRSAGGRLVGDAYDGEPGIDRALRVRAPGSHVFKPFCGVETGQVLDAGDRPLKFEHASVKAPRPTPLECFLTDGLGFRFSDRMAPLASWWHCDADHHGIAITLARATSSAPSRSHGGHDHPERVMPAHPAMHQAR